MCRVRPYTLWGCQHAMQQRLCQACCYHVKRPEAMTQALPLCVRRGLRQDALRSANDHFAHLLLPAHYGNPCGHEEERLRRASEIEGREPGVPPAPSCRVWDLAPSDKNDNGREGSIIASLSRGGDHGIQGRRSPPLQHDPDGVGVAR
jgi:hypothetical protein